MPELSDQTSLISDPALLLASVNLPRVFPFVKGGGRYCMSHSFYHDY